MPNPLDVFEDVYEAATDVYEWAKDKLKQAGRAVVANAGAAAFMAAKDKVSVQRNGGKPRQQLTQDRKDKLRGDFGALVDEVRIVFGSSLLDHFTIELPAADDIKVNIPHTGFMKAQTFGLEIFIEQSYLAGDQDQLELIAHEMVHSRQWINCGRQDVSFGKAYFGGWFDAGFSYEGNVMEREAYAFEHCFSIRSRSSYKVTGNDVAATPSSWTASFQAEVGGQPCVGFYNRQTGAVSIHAFVESPIGLTQLWAGGWPKGITVIAPFVLSGKLHAVLYNGTTGLTTFGRLPDALGGGAWMSLGTEQWSAGWTSIAPFPLQGRVLYLKYKTESGHVKMERVKPDGSGREDVWDDNWNGGYTSVVPFTHSGSTYLLMYKRDQKGVGKILKVQSDGKVATTLELNWSQGWQHLSVFTIGAAPHLLLYKDGNPSAASYRRGEVKVISLHPSDKTKISPLACGAWSADWKFASAVRVGSTTYLLRARWSDASLRVERMEFK